VSTGAPAALLWSTAGTKDLAEFLRIIAIISSAETLTIFDGKTFS
jgi:hypothetical protein